MVSSASSTEPRVLCMDPGIATFGLASMRASGHVVSLSACGTKVGDDRPGKGKGRTSYDLRDRERRTRELLDWIDSFVDEVGPPRIVVAEAGRNMGPGVGDTAKIYLGAGQTIAMVTAWRYGVPLVWATQLEWRRVLIPKPRSGRHGTYAQDEIVDAIGKDVDELAKKILRYEGKSITLRDHAIDAVGMGRWAVFNSAAVRRALGMVGATGL